MTGRRLPTVPTLPPEIVVRDEEEACSYLPGRRARQPLREPVRPLTGAEFDARLEAGDRRAGPLLYNQECPACAACEPIRVDVRAFAPSRSQRRAQARGSAAVAVELGPIEVDAARVALYRAHERGRGLDRDGRPAIDPIGYESVFALTCVDGFELRYTVGDRLAGVAITDRGERALSAVYTFWDPAHAALSLGTFSILTQIALARRWGLDWLYLGLAIRDNHSMAYKMAFMPHERRIGGTWRRFARSET
ncbi:MAG TPA: arginyltransferase [Polyangia bacterium]|nr:arginyltransferase [Polyangia bacterium]